MANNIIKLTVNEFIEQEIKKRDEYDNPSDVAVRDLTRLYILYNKALQEVELTISEALIICEVLNKTVLDIDEALDLWLVVENACQLDNIHKAWDMKDSEPLVQKLKALSLVKCMAIIDAAEQFWLTSDYSDGGIYGVARRLFLCAEEVCPFSFANESNENS